MNTLRINEPYYKQFPANCPVIEQTGDGVEVGTCTYYAPGGICPRHGNWRILVIKSRPERNPAQAGESEKK
jgi:hypothetical protein